MHPSERTAVRTGPDCVCGHSRLEHVGYSERYNKLDRDLGCQDPRCTGCPKYAPLGPLHRDVLWCSDYRLDEEDWCNERNSMRRFQLFAFLWLAAAIALSILTQVVHEYAGLPLTVVCLLAMTGALATYARLSLKAIGRLETPRLLVSLSAMTPAITVPVIAIAPLLSAPPFTGVYVAVGLTGMSVALLALDSHRSNMKFKKMTRSLRQDLDDALAAATSLSAPMGEEPPNR
jgi:hypothetical protein